MNPAVDAGLDSREGAGSGALSIFARLARLSGRRDPNTGRYADLALSEDHSGEEIDRLLRSAHEKAFAEWLGHSLEAKRAGCLPSGQSPPQSLSPIPAALP